MSKPYGYRRLLIGQGAAQEPKTLEGAGTTGQALRIATTGDEPTWGTLNAATVLGTTKVPAANGGTGIDSSASTGVAHVAAGTWTATAVDLAAADVTGVLPVANGGTGQAVGAIAIMQFYGAAVAAGATVFLGAVAAAAPADVRFSSVVTGSALSMRSRAQNAPGGTETYTYTLQVIASDTALTHVVTGAAIVGNSNTPVAIAAGNGVVVKLVTSAAAAVNNHSVTIAIRVDGV